MKNPQFQTQYPLASKELNFNRVCTEVKTLDYHSPKSIPASFGSFTFITRNHFNELTKLGVSALDLSKVSSYSQLKCVSPATNAKMTALNCVLHYFFLGVEVFQDCYGLDKNDPIVTNAKTSVVSFLNRSESYIPLEGGTQKYYEILPIDGKLQLIVVEGGFLKFLTQDKSNCLQFVLASLRAFDKFGEHNASLNSLYLKLLLVEPYYRLVCIRGGAV